MTRGYFAVGIHGCKTESNVGSLWRSATLYGAAFVFTVGHRYRPQASDTPRTPLHTPLFQFASVDDLVEHLPSECPLVGVELNEDAHALPSYGHPERVAYLLGAEDHGLPAEVMDRCHQVVSIPSARPQSMNVACAGSVLLYDRYVKARRS